MSVHLRPLRRPDRPRWWHLATLASGAGVIVVWLAVTQARLDAPDANAYWEVGRRASMYLPPGTPPAYLYPPPFAQILWPFLGLPRDAFVAGVRALELLSLLYLAGPLALPALFLEPVAAELHAGNISLILMATVVLGFRHPWLWTIVLLTKPTVGLALLWFAMRKEWRSLVIATIPAGAIALASFIADPAPWFAWVDLLTRTDLVPDVTPYPFSLLQRAPVAIILVALGVRSDQRWPVVLAGIVSMPRLYFPAPAMLFAVLRVLPRPAPARWPFRRRRPSTGTALGDPAAAS